MTFWALRISHGQAGIAVLVALNQRPVLDRSSRPRPRFGQTAQ
jgi:hypothetical protein